MRLCDVTKYYALNQMYNLSLLNFRVIYSVQGLVYNATCIYRVVYRRITAKIFFISRMNIEFNEPSHTRALNNTLLNLSRSIFQN